MGTRADFYVGRDPEAEWLGSIAWDGDPSSIEQNILYTTDEQIYRDFVNLWLADRDDATFPEHGWPWPWDDSRLTDYAYAFDKDRVWGSCFGRAWFDPIEFQHWESEDHERYMKGQKNAVFPDMASRKNVTYGPRSGLIVIRA